MVSTPGQAPQLSTAHACLPNGKHTRSSAPAQHCAHTPAKCQAHPLRSTPRLCLAAFAQHAALAQGAGCRLHTRALGAKLKAAALCVWKLWVNKLKSSYVSPNGFWLSLFSPSSKKDPPFKTTGGYGAPLPCGARREATPEKSQPPCREGAEAAPPRRRRKSERPLFQLPRFSKGKSTLSSPKTDVGKRTTPSKICNMGNLFSQFVYLFGRGWVTRGPLFSFSANLIIIFGQRSRGEKEGAL